MIVSFLHFTVSILKLLPKTNTVHTN